MIPGLTIRPDFLTEAEEKALIEIIGGVNEVLNQGVRRNTVKRYGSNLPYKAKMVSEVIPGYLNDLSIKLFESKIIDFIPDSITINEYKQGQGIDYHIDNRRSGRVIVVISLLSDSKFLMRDKITKAAQEFDFPARALLKMEGVARYNYEHAVPPVAQDRISIVFRKATKI